MVNSEEDGQNVQVLQEEPKQLYRAKFLKFDENRRPAYYGTWRKTSTSIRPRNPLGKDSVALLFLLYQIQHSTYFIPLYIRVNLVHE